MVADGGLAPRARSPPAQMTLRCLIGAPGMTGTCYLIDTLILLAAPVLADGYIAAVAMTRPRNRGEVDSGVLIR